MQGRTLSLRNVVVCGVVLAGIQFVRAASVDLDHDGSISLSDYADFYACFHGPNIPVSDAPCAEAHFDADTDIDLADFAQFQLRFHPGKVGNFCDSPIDAIDGTVAFSTIGATTDGPDEPNACLFFGNSQVSNDLWYCYTATCTSDAAVSLCGSSYDTKVAVYDGCGCPSAEAMACNDDGCGSDVTNVQSRVTVPMVSGHQYLIRVGGYIGATGDGLLTIRCGNTDACSPTAGDCFIGNQKNQPGCNDTTCCHETCTLDQFCCDVVWDNYCAGEAVGICTGNFASCTAGAGNCDEAQTTPGCNNSSCCNTVCQSDPFCCLTMWDADCTGEANGACFLTCTPQAGDCFSGHATAGCNNSTCCEKVCGGTNADTFCCDTEWDGQCASEALGLCSP